MKFKNNITSNVIDLNSVKQKKITKKLKLVNTTLELDENILDLMKNEFDFYLNKEIEVLKNGNSKE